jgi:WD40 domain-containing protein
VVVDVADAMMSAVGTREGEACPELEGVAVTVDGSDGVNLGDAREHISSHTRDSAGDATSGASSESIASVFKGVVEICTLRGHRAAVSDISWSPFDAHRLASASFDGSVQVCVLCVVLQVRCICMHPQYPSQCLPD